MPRKKLLESIKTVGVNKARCPCKACVLAGHLLQTAQTIRRHIGDESYQTAAARQARREFTAIASQTAASSSCRTFENHSARSSASLPVDDDAPIYFPPVPSDDASDDIMMGQPNQSDDLLFDQRRDTLLDEYVEELWDNQDRSPPPPLGDNREDGPAHEYAHEDQDEDEDVFGADLDYDLDDLPPAFYEHPLIRNIYIRVYIESAFNYATQESIKSQLHTHHQTLLNVEELCNVVIPGLDRMAQTLRTVERRLGVNADRYIRYYFLCPVCWRLYHPTALKDLNNSTCLEEFCEGILYTERQLADRTIRRVPLKVFPTCPMIPQLQRMLLRPGTYEDLQRWRKPGDEPGPTPPLEANYRLDPTQPLTDIMDGWGWRCAQAGLERRRNADSSIEDVDVLQLDQRFVSLPLGLMLMVNIDWFTPTKSNKYSCGAVYVTICNNAREKRFRREETILVCVIPGPHEPSLEQLNSVLTPFIDDVLILNQGVPFKIYKQPGRMLAHTLVYINSSDLPAGRKLVGGRGVTSKRFMCLTCKKRVESLTHPDCFDPNTFELRDDWRFLKYAFKARDDPDLRDEIAERRGIRWSALNELPGWLPARNSPVEFMHAVFLGETKHVINGIIVGGGLLTTRKRTHRPKERLEKFLEDIIWPGSVGRIPSNIFDGGIKADQWRHLSAVLPVALFVAWQVKGIIPDKDAPHPRSRTKAAAAEKRKEDLLRSRRRRDLAQQAHATLADYEDTDTHTMDRNYCRHYENVLEHCTALRIWASRSITPNEARRAQDCHGRACRAWARMHCHLTPNFHLAEHYEDTILRLGPVYGWWGYPMEQHNGFLKKFRLNGHGGGEMESTMMRGWVKYSLISDLLLRLESLEEPDHNDEDIIKTLKQYIGGTPKGTRRRSSMMEPVNQEQGVEYPCHASIVDLRSPNFGGTYAFLFRYLRYHWSDEVDLVPDTAPVHAGEAFVANAVRSYAYIFYQGIRYGVTMNYRGKKYRYAYIEGRQPVRIVFIFRITHMRRTPSLPPLEHTVAVVQRFQPPDTSLNLPWEIRAGDLGIGTWKADTYGDLQIIPVTQFSGQFALATIHVRKVKYWVTISLDHGSQEPDLNVEGPESDSESMQYESD